MTRSRFFVCLAAASMLFASNADALDELDLQTEFELVSQDYALSLEVSRELEA